MICASEFCLSLSSFKASRQGLDFDPEGKTVKEDVSFGIHNGDGCFTLGARF